MAVRDDFAAGEVLAAADLNDTFASKLDLAGGKILQIVRATDSTGRTTTSTSYVDVTGMAVTITPQKTDSALLVVAAFSMSLTWTSGSIAAGYAGITDSSNNALSGVEESVMNSVELSGSGTRQVTQSFTEIAYVTPATTSAVTYKLRFRSVTSGITTEIRNDDKTGQMYAIEVSA